MKVAIQKMQDPNGNLMEFTESVYDVEYYEIETFTHIFKKPSDALAEMKQKVKSMREDGKYIDADTKAEKYIRDGTKPKRMLPRDEQLEALEHAWKTFKKEIFGYDQLTKKQQITELTGGNQTLDEVQALT